MIKEESMITAEKWMASLGGLIHKYSSVSTEHCSAV